MSRPWKAALYVLVIGCGLFAAGTAVATFEVTRHAREWAIDWLSQRYNSEVQLDSFHVSVYPRIGVTGENLALRFEGRPDLPPLIAAKRFTLEAAPLELLRNPRRVAFVRLEGLAINIPPRLGSPRAPLHWDKDVGNIRSASFGEIVSDDATLRIFSADPTRQPLTFHIDHVTLHSTRADGQLAFRATLSNPTPPGRIFSSGTIGPWVGATPSLTAVAGSYTFSNADLGVFPGIAGILSAQGTYHGVLERIETDGATDTPNFRLTRAGHAVDLKTAYHAIVDGTDGNTYLEPVEASFLNTVLVARGKAEGVKGQPGKTIQLNVTSTQARIEDLLWLTVSQPAAMTGPTQLQTTFLLPHGAQDLTNRLILHGSFKVASAHFTNGSLQQKFDDLSKRGLGDAHDLRSPNTPDPSDDVASDMNGKFGLRSGVLKLSQLSFRVPGADITLDGTYQFQGEMLDLHGYLSMKAKLSQTTTGIKSLLLRPLDRLFSKNGNGTVLPIKIVGPVKQPTYGLDFHHKESANADLR